MVAIILDVTLTCDKMVNLEGLFGWLFIQLMHWLEWHRVVVLRMSLFENGSAC